MTGLTCLKVFRGCDEEFRHRLKEHLADEYNRVESSGARICFDKSSTPALALIYSGKSRGPSVSYRPAPPWNRSPWLHLSQVFRENRNPE